RWTGCWPCPDPPPAGPVPLRRPTGTQRSRGTTPGAARPVVRSELTRSDHDTLAVHPTTRPKRLCSATGSADGVGQDPAAGHLPCRCAGGLPMSPKSDDVLAVHGGTPLHGEVRVRGAKNLVSKAMVAALLGDSPSRLFDVP